MSSSHFQVLTHDVLFQIWSSSNVLVNETTFSTFNIIWIPLFSSCSITKLMHLTYLISFAFSIILFLKLSFLTWLILVLLWYSYATSFYPSISPVAQAVKRLPAMQETWVQSLGQEDPLEKDMATHSSILAWRIPWTEEPARLQSMRSQKIRHDWMTSLHFTSPYIRHFFNCKWNLMTPCHLLKPLIEFLLTQSTDPNRNSKVCIVWPHLTIPTPFCVTFHIVTHTLLTLALLQVFIDNTCLFSHNLYKFFYHFRV